MRFAKRLVCLEKLISVERIENTVKKFQIPTDEDKNLLGAVDPETINELNQIRLDIGKHQPKPVEKTKEMSQEIDDMKGLLMQSNIRADSNLGKKMAQLVSSEAKVSDQILKNAIVKELNDKNDTDIEIEVPELQPELLSSINIIDSHIYNDIEEQVGLSVITVEIMFN